MLRFLFLFSSLYSNAFKVLMCSHFVSKILELDRIIYQQISWTNHFKSFDLLSEHRMRGNRKKSSNNNAYVSLTRSIILSTCKHSYAIHRKTTALKLNALIQIQSNLVLLFLKQFLLSKPQKQKLFSIQRFSFRNHFFQFESIFFFIL